MSGFYGDYYGIVFLIFLILILLVISGYRCYGAEA